MENKDTDYQKVARVGDEKNNQDHFFFCQLSRVYMKQDYYCLYYYYYYYYYIITIIIILVFIVNLEHIPYKIIQLISVLHCFDL